MAWYADGDNMVRNEYNPNIAYAFGECSSTHLGTILHCVMGDDEKEWSSGKMEGINIFMVFFWK